jgi:hypothetical protein
VYLRSVFLVAFASIAPASASEKSPFDPAQLPASARPYLEQAALVANAENSVRTLVPADEVSGISQIMTLLGHTNFEEQWVFVPAIDLWIEIGTNESVSELDSQVEIDTDYLGQIVSLYHEVQIFHFHPAGFYERVWQHEPHPVGFSADALESGDMQPVGFALPSPNDVVASIELSKMLLAKDPLARITYAVVSPHGVVTYGPTVHGLRTMIYNWGNPRATIARSVVTRIAIRRQPFSIASTIDSLHSPTIGEVIEALCAQSSDENYMLSFQPF